MLLIFNEAGCRYTGVFFAAITAVISVILFLKKINSIVKTKQKN